MNWNDVELFCADCIMKDVNICPCDDIVDHFNISIADLKIASQVEEKSNKSLKFFVV